jgi:hypothetical protein
MAGLDRHPRLGASETWMPGLRPGMTESAIHALCDRPPSRGNEVATVIYLDTHHLSRIASGKSQISRFFSDPAFLFVFSTSHVVESLPKEATDNPGAIARLNIILSQESKWLFGWGKVASLEKAGRLGSLSELFCRKDELLFPEFKMDRSQWLRRARSDVKEMLVNRFQDDNLRRSVQARLIKQGKLTAEAFGILRQSFDDTLRRNFVDFPQAIPFFANSGFYDYLEGKISEEEFKARFMSLLADPIGLATMSSIPELASILDFSRFFWIQMDNLAEVLSKFIMGLRSDFSRSSVIDYPKEKSKIEEGLKEHGLRAALVRRLAGVEVSEQELMTMPGTRLFVDLFAEYMLEKVDRYANPASADFKLEPTFKRSDAADFTHVFYYPYADVFGCDKAMRDRMKRAGWSTEKVVATDGELEAKLEAQPNR